VTLKGRAASCISTVSLFWRCMHDLQKQHQLGSCALLACVLSGGLRSRAACCAP
jgi:hypothetical protein